MPIRITGCYADQESICIEKDGGHYVGEVKLCDAMDFLNSYLRAIQSCLDFRLKSHESMMHGRIERVCDYIRSGKGSPSGGMADTADLKSAEETRAGSTPASGTTCKMCEGTGKLTVNVGETQACPQCSPL